MFNQLKNIDNAFRHIRLFTLVLTISYMGAGCFTVYTCLREIRHVESQVYVLSNGQLFRAVAADREKNIPVELRDHIRNFHYWFFTLDADESVIRQNISRALYLADGTASRQYETLKESGYYTNMINGNVTQWITEDSISLDLSGKPYHFHYYGKLKITRPTSEAIRSLITEGDLRESFISDNNPHGFLIERWRILENKDLQIKPREQ